MRVAPLLLIVGCAADLGPDSAVPCSGTLDHPRAGALQAVVDDAVERGLPGLAVAVRTPDGVWAGAAGMADLEDGVPLTTCHVHPWASVGKTWHAVLAVRMAQAGELDLETPLRDLLEADTLRGLANADRVTLRQLLDHSSGIPEFNEDLGYIGSEFDAPPDPTPPEETLDWLRGDPPLFEPGQGYHYADTNYLLLALAIERVTGDLPAAMRRHVLDPLGLQHTTFPRPGDGEPVGRVNAYWELRDGVLENVSAKQAQYDVQIHGAGNTRTTVLDALAFTDALDRDETFLAPEWRVQMQVWNPAHPDLEEGGGYGLGISRVTDANGVVWVGHTGGDIGAGAVIRGQLDTDRSIVAVTNVGMFLGGPLQDVWNEDLFAALAAAAE